MPVPSKDCKYCGEVNPLHWPYQCRMSPKVQKRKPINQTGKQYKLWVTFRDYVAKPYLDKKYGHICNAWRCTETTGLDVDHIKNKGSHQHLKFDVANMQYLCRSHHRKKTDGKKLKYKHG